MKVVFSGYLDADTNLNNCVRLGLCNFFKRMKSRYYWGAKYNFRRSR